jgi:hypothetical protein
MISQAPVGQMGFCGNLSPRIASKYEVAKSSVRVGRLIAHGLGSFRGVWYNAPVDSAAM